MNAEVSGNSTIIRVEDPHLDHENELELRRLVKKQMTEGVKKVLIDLAQVIQISSLGLGALVTSQKVVNRNDGQMRLCSVQADVLSMMELTQLSQLFLIYPNEQSALKD